MPRSNLPKYHISPLFFGTFYSPLQLSQNFNFLTKNKLQRLIASSVLKINHLFKGTFFLSRPNLPKYHIFLNIFETFHSPLQLSWNFNTLRKTNISGSRSFVSSGNKLSAKGNFCLFHSQTFQKYHIFSYFSEIFTPLFYLAKILIFW